METDQNNNYVDISELGFDNAPDPSSINDWEEFLGDFDFYEITESVDYAKTWKRLSAEHLSKVWRINMESSQKTTNVTAQRGVSTDKPKLTRNLSTGPRMLRYKSISEFLFIDNLFVTNKSGK